jgi:hypothetical protein
MATATITPQFTVLSTCDASTGWTGITTVDTEFFKQGSASLSGISRTAGANLRYYTTTAINLTNTHIRMWLNFASVGFLQTQALGGICIYVLGGTAGYWYVGGIDTYPGGWVLLTIDTSKAFDSGTANLSSVTRVGFELRLTGAPRNAVNTWVDYLVYGNSVTVTGGTSGDPITWNDISLADTTAGYGAIQRSNAVYFCSTAVIIGDGTGSLNTYLEDDNQIIVFENQPVNANLYKLEAVGSATNTTSFKLSNTVIKSANTATRFVLDLDNSNLDILTFTNNIVVNANTTFFKSGQTIIGSTWNNCNQITTAGATFSGNTVLNSTITTGALLWPNDASVYDCFFSGNSRAIQMTTAGSYTFNALTFSNNTYDINNTSGGSITVGATNGSNPSTYLGTVTIQNTVILTIEGIVANSEVRIVQAGTATPVTGAGLTNGGIENTVTDDGLGAGTTKLDVPYNYPTGYNIDIFIMHLEYEYLKISNLVLPSSNSKLKVEQQPDRNYLDPA